MAIGILGGTFDPVHQAHLQMAAEAKANLNLESLKLVPCYQPPHRHQPLFTPQQRLALLEIAVQPYDGLVVDDREFHRKGNSYTVDTLQELREEVGAQQSLVFLLGMDAYSQLDQWYQWETLRELAHIVVMHRPQALGPVEGILAEWLANADDKVVVHQQPAGGFVVLEQSLLSVSATQIRAALEQFMASDINIPDNYLPEPVKEKVIEFLENNLES